MNPQKSFWLGLCAVVGTVFIISLFVTTMWRPTGMMSSFWPGRAVTTGSTGSVASGGFVGAPMMDSFYTDTESAGAKAADFSLIAPIPSPSAGDTAATTEPRIIKTGNLSLEVDSARTEADKISAIAKNKNGFVESSNVSEDTNGDISAYITVRVPEDKFDETMNEIKALATRIETDSTNGQDVTEQYTDLEARLRNAQAQEERYLAILDKANNVTDILAVEQYLSQTRYEIESLQGQIKYLGNQTSYSTISITLFESARVELPTAKFDLLGDIKEAARAVILLAQAAITFLVWFVIIGAAFTIPTVLFVFVVYKVVMKFVRR